MILGILWCDTRSYFFLGIVFMGWMKFLVEDINVIDIEKVCNVCYKENVVIVGAFAPTSLRFYLCLRHKVDTNGIDASAGSTGFR